MGFADPERKRAYHRAYQRDWRARNLAKVQGAEKARYIENREQIRDRQRWSHLLRKYGVTKDDYQRMLDEQGGVCAVCGNPPRGRHALAVDHCHDTGRVRGLLCQRCNPLIERVAAYLEASEAGGR